MEINNNTIINVYNYMPCKVIATSNVQDYVFDACEDMNAPIVIPMSAVEVKNIHSKSHIFTDGYLTFDDSEKSDIYEYLKIFNWEDILTQTDIIDAMLNCTKEKLQKIIDIKSISYFERIRGVYTALKQQRADISIRVADTIEARYRELLNGKITTSIELVDTKYKDDSSLQDGVDKEKIAAMEKQIKEKDAALKDMSERMAKLEQLIAVSHNLENKETTKAKPNRGKPSSKS